MQKILLNLLNKDIQNQIEQDIMHFTSYGIAHFLFEFLHLNTLFIYFEVFKNVNYLFNLLSILFLY